MKGIIITLTGNYNYGNRLQNYALQEILERKGVEIETYNNIYINPKTTEIKRKMSTKNLKRIIKGIKSRISKKNKHNMAVNKKRTDNIKVFTEKFIKVSKVLKDELNSKYDCFILGSDQIWNPNFINDFEINLGIVGKGKKVISYAASFGIDEINSEIYDMYRKSIIDMDSISVREEEGKKIVEKISGKSAEVVLDPTMLIHEKDWKKIEKKPENWCEEEYLLVYCVSKTYSKMKKYIKKVADKYNLKIINLTDKSQEEYISGVEEFLYYIDNAKMIITDSFHACVFSILFRKNFWVMERKQKGMNSRIDTLLETFNIINRKLYEGQNFESCNYDNLDKILEEKRDKSLRFLYNALGI